MKLSLRRTGRAPAVVAGIAVGAITAGGIAYAATPAAEGTVNACYAKQGDLRIVEEGEACKSNETAISWNQKGEKGDPGEPGAKGDPGEDGADGQQGPAGTDGQSPVEIATWRATWSGSGSDHSGEVAGETPIASGDIITVMAGTVLSGDFSSCTGGFGVRVSLPDGTPSPFLVAREGSSGGIVSNEPPAQGQGSSATASVSVPGLQTIAGCRTTGLQDLPVSDYQLTFVFEWARTPPRITYN